VKLANGLWERRALASARLRCEQQVVVATTTGTLARVGGDRAVANVGKTAARQLSSVSRGDVHLVEEDSIDVSAVVGTTGGRSADVLEAALSGLEEDKGDLQNLIPDNELHHYILTSGEQEKRYK
jgi:hypothetical protein